jgi:(p)ppGpp synthase/HD superfamily hydrolase
MNMLALAISIMAQAFLHKTDKGGKSYTLHCLRVMHALRDEEEEVQQIAALHDVPEDTDISMEDLRKHGFSERVIKAVDLLTHRPGVPYMDYIKALSVNSDAVKVKRKDLEDNSQITRLKGLTKKDFDRMEKYHIAYTYLSSIS